MQQLKFFMLIVVYNKKCTELMPFFQAFEKRDCTLIVYDNSVTDLGNRAFCEACDVVYLGGKGNRGLSKAYNAAVESCFSRGEDGYLCLFDDDTMVTGDYLDHLKESATGERAIFVPLLYAENRLISPAKLKNNFHCSFFADKEAALAYDGHRLTALNAGMAIPLSLFDHYRYDERLFLDGIDHTFIKDMIARKVPVRIFDFAMEQRLSSFEKPPLERALHRFRIFKKDVKVFAGRQYRRVLLRRMLKLTLQYKTAAFWKEYKA